MLLTHQTIPGVFDGNAYNTNLTEIENSFLDLGPYVISGLVPSAGAGLTVSVTAGTASIGGRVTASGAFNITGLADNIPNHLYILNTGGGTSNTTGTAPANSAKLGTCVTAGGVVTSVDITRASGRQQFVQSQNLVHGGGGSGLAGNPRSVDLSQWNATQGNGFEVFGVLPGGAMAGAVIVAPATSARNVIQPTVDTATALALKKHSATQTAAALNVLDETGAVLTSIGPDGHIGIGSVPGIATVIIGASADLTSTVTIVSGNAGAGHVFNATQPLLDLQGYDAAGNEKGEIAMYPDAHVEFYQQTTAGGFSDERVGEIVPGLLDNTDAVWKGRMDFMATDFNADRLALRLEADGVMARVTVAGSLTLARPALAAPANPTFFTFSPGADTALTASVEANDVAWNLNRIQQFATGALATQRAVLIQAPTYAFVGASTIANAATLAITGAPLPGTNATLTSTAALWIKTGLDAGKGLILQANSVTQAANLLELQSSAAVMLSAFDQTGRLGINTQPGFRLHILQTGANDVTFDRYGDTAAFSGRSAGGTVSVPTATPSGQNMMQFRVVGYDGSVFTGAKGILSARAAELWSSTTQGLFWSLQTTSVGTTSTIENISFHTNAQLILGVAAGTPAPPAQLQVRTYLASNVVCQLEGIASQTAALLVLAGKSSTTFGREMAAVDTAWISSTDASRTGRLILSATDFNGRKTGLQLDTDGTNVRVGVKGQTPTAWLHLPAGAAAASSAPFKLTSGPVLSTAEAGAMEYRTPSFYITPVTNRRGLVLSSDIFAAEQTVANTTTETTLYTGNIAANEMGSRVVFRVVLVGRYSALITDSFTLKFKQGGTTFLTLVSPLAAVTNGYWKLECILLCQTTGVTGTVISDAMLIANNAIISAADTGTHTVDTTAVQNLTVTVTWSAASASDTITASQLFMEELSG